MKKYIAAVKKANVWILLMIAFLLAALLELCVFQFSFFSQNFGNYNRIEMDLSQKEGYNGEALPLLPENPTVSFDGLSERTRSVTVYTAGPAQVLSGNIGICDAANAYRTTGAGSFQVNPGGRESSFTVRLNSHGELTRLRINFTEELKEPVFLLSVVLNERVPLRIHGLRLFLLTGLLFVLLSILRFRLYEAEYCPEKKSHRRMNLLVLAFCLLVSGWILYGGAPSHQYLRPYPALEEIRSSEMVVDAYMQQLDAFEKGQTALDLDVNPALEELDNPYDKGERDKKEITYHWDRAYYNGQYYSYFGLAPLFMVYYPVYWLTGMIPTELLAGTLLSVFAILAVFGAIHGLYRIFRPRANLVLFLTGEAAVVFGSFLYLMQASLSFYYLPLISGAGWLAAFTAFSCYACLSEKGIRRMLLFALAGISVVMLVLSRPNMLLLAAAFAAPLFLRILFDRTEILADKLRCVLPFLIPVLLGGIGVMYYNRIRFGSVFEFGTAFQLTESDIRYNGITLSMHHFLSMAYHYFLESFVYTEFFPFLRFTTEKCIDFGNYLYQEYSVGLFRMPLNLGIILAGLTFCGKDKKDSLKRWTGGLMLLGILGLGYIDFLLGGIHIRYVCDLSLAVSLLAFLLILGYVHFDGTRSSRILYVITLGLLLLTIGRGWLTIFSNETNAIRQANPDFYLSVARMFRL
ncbi:MAG: hypothetical protein HFI25_03790 [Lachnospiraceae bacterium]|nr:hypothetical protein [Lachnospiraceae bacterium]